MVRDHPDRFMGLGTLPMQDLERAIDGDGARDERARPGRLHDRRPRQRPDLRRAEVSSRSGRPRSASAPSSSSTSSSRPWSRRTDDYFLLNSIGNLVDRTSPSRVHLRRRDGRVPGADDLPRARAADTCRTPSTGSTRAGRCARKRAGATQGPAQHLPAAVLLRHGHLHRSEPALPARRASAADRGRVRHRLAGPDDLRRTRSGGSRRARCSTTNARTCCGVPAASILTGGGRDLARPKVFVVQPVMDVGRRALEEFADVEVHDSERMIGRDALLAGVRDATTSGCSATRRSTRR